MMPIRTAVTGVCTVLTIIITPSGRCGLHHHVVFESYNVADGIPISGFYLIKSMASIIRFGQNSTVDLTSRNDDDVFPGKKERIGTGSEKINAQAAEWARVFWFSIFK